MPMHHDHDPELVMSLAEGNLDIADPAMGARVGDCAECLEEIRLQRVALAVLQAAPAVRLDDLESRRLRREMATALGHEEPVPVEDVASKRQIAWAPLASIAAVLLAIVLVAPSLDLVGGDSDDSADFETALDQELGEADADGGDGDDAGADADSPLVSEDTLAATAQQPPSATTEAQEMATTMAGDSTAAASGPERLSEDALTPLGEILALVVAGGEDEAAAELSNRDLFAYEPLPGDECTVAGAIAVGGLLESSSLGILDLGEDGPRVIVTVHRDPQGETTAVAHDPATCSVLLVTP